MAKEKVSYSLTSDRIKKALKKDDKKNPKLGYLEPFKETGIPFEGEYDFGGDLDGAIERFGKDVVYSHFRISAGLSVGNRVRDYIEAGLDSKAVQKNLDGYVIGVKRASSGLKKDPRAAYAAKLSGLSEEEKAAELRKLAQELGLV